MYIGGVVEGDEANTSMDMADKLFIFSVDYPPLVGLELSFCR